MMMIIISTCRDYVYKLRPPKGLLFFPQTIHEHGEPWWIDIDRKTPESSTRPFWQSYQQSYLVAKQEGLAKKIMNFALRSISFTFLRFFLTCHNILQYGADGFTPPPKEGVLRIFIVLNNSSPSVGF
jgi:hypothetical protein